ncbi:hypothetical protein ACC859_39345, partial [Rhizobium ruizarguesonis]
FIFQMDTIVHASSANVSARSEAEPIGKLNNGLRVRLFQESDIPAVREIMIQHHAATVFRNQRFSDWKLNQHFQTILS